MYFQRYMRASRTSLINDWLGLHFRKEGEKVKDCALEYNFFFLLMPSLRQVSA